MYRLAAAALTAVIIQHLTTISSARESGPQGVFELRLKKFNNFHASDINGNCCEGLKSNGYCAGRCNTKFRICLKHFQNQVDYNQDCTFGEEITPVLGSNNITINRAPIKFDINFKWPGTFSLIIEAYHESRNGELVPRNNQTLLHRITKSQSLDSGSNWVYGEDSKLQYDYRLVCGSSYYGRDCDIICKPRNDNFGHYTCGPSGEKVCLDGWEKDNKNLARDDYCLKPKCAPGCSETNGYCSKPGECKCHEGWKGHLCNECKIYPGCVHGTCSKPWTCDCEEGWGGQMCNKDLNFCTNNRPCHNGATCFNTGKDYTCSCPIGFTGRNCEIRVVNKCDEFPCRNGGNCQAGSNDGYTCTCASGFHGPHCEFTSDFDICSKDNPCENGATCMSGMSGYTCSCPPGFEGRNCENVIDHCETGPCQNDGICFPFINDFKCVCQNGFIGRNCEENYDDCQNNPCANGGTCADGVNDFECTCAPGFTGKDCSQEINECDPNPCLNGGFCKDGNNTFTCICLPQFSGIVCEILPTGKIDPDYYAQHNTQVQGEGSSGNAVLIGIFSSIVPIGVLAAIIGIYCMKHRRKMEQERADFEAQMENELNAVQSINKSKVLDDHMIVNSLDYPKQKCINNTNPNIADEDVFNAKDSAYAQMSRTKSTKQLNTDAAVNRASLYCDKLENGVSRTNTGLDKSRLAKTKSNNLDISSSTLNSSYSEKSSLKKEQNRDREPIYSGVNSCGSASPAPSSVYVIGDEHLSNQKCLPDDLLATEV